MGWKYTRIMSIWSVQRVTPVPLLALRYSRHGLVTRSTEQPPPLLRRCSGSSSSPIRGRRIRDANLNQTSCCYLRDVDKPPEP